MAKFVQNKMLKNINIEVYNLLKNNINGPHQFKYEIMVLIGQDLYLNLVLQHLFDLSRKDLNPEQQVGKSQLRQA